MILFLGFKFGSIFFPHERKTVQGFFAFCWTSLVVLVQWQYDTQRVSGLLFI